MNNLLLSISPDKRTLPQSERNYLNNTAFCAGALWHTPTLLILFLTLLSTFNFQLSTYAQDTPPFPTDNLQLWLRADSVELTDGKVSRWYDLSPNNYEITQPNASARPEILDSLNNNPTITFRLQDFLYGGDILDLGTDSWTWIIVENTATDGTFVSKNVYVNAPGRWFFNSNMIWAHTSAANGDGRIDYNSKKIFDIITWENDRQIAKNKIYINNIIDHEANISAPEYNMDYNCNFVIGGYISPAYSGTLYSGNRFAGQIAEIIAFNTIDSTLRDLVYNYLIGRYSTTISLGQDITSLCDIDVSAYNPDFVSYQWSTGETDPVIHVSQNGNYSVTVTNSFGITSTDDINVYFPEIYQRHDTTICYGDTIYWGTGLDAGGYTFQWMKDGTPYADASNRIEIFEGGAYTCVITDSLGCRFQTDTVHIAIDDYPISTSFIADGTWSVQTDTSLCSGNTIGLATNIDETTSYIWNTDATSSRITLTETGDYSLTTTNNRGCRAVNSIHVNILGEAPEINYTIDNLCYGDSTSFACNAELPQDIESYIWIVDGTDSISAQSFNYEFANTGNHNIRNIVTSNNSCRTDSSFSIAIKEIAIPNFTYTPVCYGVPMDFIDNSSIPEGTTVDAYTWMIEDSVIGDEANLRYTFNNSPLSVSEAYVVNLTYYISLSNGCTSDTTIEVSIHSEYSEPRFVSPAYPANGMFVSSDSITFLWNYDYDILYYNLITSSSPDFSNADTISCTSNNITLPYENFDDTTYWKVVSYNHCLLSFESEPYSFRKTVGKSAVSTNPNLQLWLRADSVELSEGKISRWYDLSPNNYEITQPNVSTRPEIIDSLNNNPTITFRLQDFLYGGDILDLGIDSWTWIIVENTATDGTFVSKNVYVNAPGRWFFNSNMVWAHTSAANGDGRIDYNSKKIFDIITWENDRQIAKNKIYINNIIDHEANISAPEYNMDYNCNFVIGGYISPAYSGALYSDKRFAGQIAEIIAFNTIDSTLRNQVYDYLYSKYVAPVTLGLDIHTTSFCDTTISAYMPDFVSYQWSTGETDSVIHVSQPGRYTVTVTNSFGVTSTDDINVYFPEAYQLQDTTICIGDTIRWDTKLAEDDYSFQWFKDGETYASTGNQIEISEAGAYNCIITDSLGCTFLTDTMQLSIDNYPISAGFGGTDGWPSISTDTTLCYGNRLHLASNYDETVSAIWQDGSTDLEYYLTQPGSYTVTTTNTRGCQAVNTIDLSLNGRVPTPNFSIDGHCQNAEVTATNLSSSSIGDITAYRWYANDSLIGTSENISHSFAQYGNQSLKLYLETSDNCFNDTTIYLYIDPEPVPDFAPKFFCQNAETEILARPAIAEGEIAATTWIINGENLYSDNISTTFTTAGMLPVSISSESLLGCSGTRSYQVVVQPAEQPSMQIAGLCLGGGTQFTNETPFSNANPQVAWEWDFGDQTAVSTRRNPTHFYAATGDYEIKLSVSFANHCTTSIDTTVRIFAQPRASITTANGCIGGQTEMLADISTDDSISSYRWTIGEIFESDEAEPIFVADTAGTFPVSLQINTEHQCKAEATGSLNIHGELDISFNQSRTWGGNPLYVEFENTSEGASSFHWDFGGMGESDISNPYFVFTEPGSYEVSLTGTNEYGCSSMYTAPAITVVEPIVDIMLMNLATKDVNGFAQISLIVVNLGTLPVTDLVLELKVNGQLYRETMEYIAQGGVVPHTFGTMIPMRQGGDLSSTICVEALVPETDGHNDMDLSNNSICMSDSENLSVGNPYPIPASEQITCDIYTKTATDLEISVFSSFGKLVKQEEIGQQKGYLKYVVSVSDLPAGMYFIRVASSDNSITYKFEVR